MQKATQQLTNHAKLPAVRRDIARVRTRLHQTSKAVTKMIDTKPGNRSGASRRNRRRREA